MYGVGIKEDEFQLLDLREPHNCGEALNLCQKRTAGLRRAFGGIYQEATEVWDGLHPLGGMTGLHWRPGSPRPILGLRSRLSVGWKVVTAAAVPKHGLCRTIRDQPALALLALPQVTPERRQYGPVHPVGPACFKGSAPRVLIGWDNHH